MEVLNRRRHEQLQASVMCIAGVFLCFLRASSTASTSSKLRSRFFYCMEKEIHIGQLIHDKLHEQGRSASWLATQIRCELLRQERSVAWLARQLGYDRSNFYRVLRAPSLATALLLRISNLLQRDFFSLYSHYYIKK